MLLGGWGADDNAEDVEKEKAHREAHGIPSELDLWMHLEERMEDRSFTDLEGRRMMETATSFRRARRRGRWVIKTKHKGKRWGVVVKPDPVTRLLEVIMTDVYLEVTYRDGRPWVAYLYLPRKNKEKSDRCREVEPGMVLDINKAGKLIGIELTAPTLVTLNAINAVLKEYGLEPLKEAALKPLLAA